MGNVTKDGSGTLTLAAPLSYTGNFYLDDPAQNSAPIIGQRNGTTNSSGTMPPHVTVQGVIAAGNTALQTVEGALDPTHQTHTDGVMMQVVNMEMGVVEILVANGNTGGNLTNLAVDAALLQVLEGMNATVTPIAPAPSEYGSTTDPYVLFDAITQFFQDNDVTFGD